eukprot:332894_1
MPSKAWEANFIRLKEFADRNGHCNVEYKGDLRYLAKWVGRQKSRNLSPEERTKLSDIGFDWRTQRQKEDDAWNGLLVKLIDYRSKHGDCNVSQNYSDDQQLGIWVANQRRLAKKNKVRRDRYEILSNIGFTWELHQVHAKPRRKKTAYDDKWKIMFQDLVKYQERHKSCDVPYNYLENPELGAWVSTQRRVFKGTTFMYGPSKKMNDERANMLKSVGFNFNKNTEESSAITVSLPKKDGNDDGDGSKFA